MFGNTTRSATVVFRFLIDTLAKFLLKRHTRFAYVARIGPCGLHRTMTGSFWDFQPLAGRGAQGTAHPTLQGSWPAVLARGVGHLAPTQVSPVTDAIGRIRRCQRSTCVAAALPEPKWRKEKSIYEGITPRTVEMIPHPPPPRQSPRSAKLARAVTAVATCYASSAPP